MGIQDLVASFGKNKPGNALKALDGNGDDMNKGFGGQYVYLVPKWDTLHNATSFSFVHSPIPLPAGPDLAMGTGGKFRYLQHIPGNPGERGIMDAALWRASEGKFLKDAQTRGWSGISNDFNAGRGGDYLYIVWR